MAMAQMRITGTVIDAKGEPLTGVFPCIALTPFERLFVYFLLITVYRTDSVDLSLRVGLLLSCFCCPFSRVIGLRTDFVDHTL
jgi:hypothetical protein